MLIKLFFFFLFLLPGLIYAQVKDQLTGTGIIAGDIQDTENSKELEGATVSVFIKGDSLSKQTVISSKAGGFLFENLENGLYRIEVKHSGYTSIRIDSIFIRGERMDFNLGSLKITKSSKEMEIVIVYAEKPLFENKDGKIIFNAGESALSNSSSATELLKQTPLVNVDADGKVLMRGKEVKILIDDKPVDLDSRQLQDLLESMPGSMIEKIEVLTTPPPQYANERGGVINIVTKKGKVGINGRLNVLYGTRGEAGFNGNASYRKKKLSINLSAGVTFNEYEGNSYSIRENIYVDSSSFFNTLASSNSKNLRPNGRLSVDYDLNKKNSFSFSFLYNSSGNKGESITQFSNINRFDQLYRLSKRNVSSESENSNPSFNLSYTLKTKDPKEILRINTGVNFNSNDNGRDFYQDYLDPLNGSRITDSFQLQNTLIKNQSVNIRINYDKPLKIKKVSLNLGANYSYFTSHNRLSTQFMKKPEYVYIENELLSNNFRFYQEVYGLRAAIRYDIIQDFYINAGLQEEFTETHFDLKKSLDNYRNRYASLLPFSTLSKKWKNGYNITLSYKRTVQRPGIGQLNPSIDYSDPYNTRFGNPFLRPYYADNYDIITGYWNKKFNINISAGYNKLRDIYSSIRELQADSKTTITWQNISGRDEYEASLWGGVNINKKMKTNVSFGYTYNVYGLHDRTVRKYRNGGSVNSSLNANFQANPLFNATANFTFNRFSNPQGTSRNNLSMNVGAQHKFLKKNLSVSVNIIDPFKQQQNRFFTYGNGYVLESSSRTVSRNVKIAVGYTFKKNTTNGKTPVKSVKPKSN
ncbi:MAG: outer membrane beta-barrel protein [Ferruginibacter sp.]